MLPGEKVDMKKMHQLKEKNLRILLKQLEQHLTLSLLGYLKTRICCGGGGVNLRGPPLNPMFDVHI